MKQYIPIAAAVGAFGAVTALGYYAGRYFGHRRIGAGIGAIGGLMVANMIGESLTEPETPSTEKAAEKAAEKAVDAKRVIRDKEAEVAAMAEAAVDRVTDTVKSMTEKAVSGNLRDRRSSARNIRPAATLPEAVPTSTVAAIGQRVANGVTGLWFSQDDSSDNKVFGIGANKILGGDTSPRHTGAPRGRRL